MSLGYRLHQLAVRGCLIAGVVLLTAAVGPCDSQESAGARTDLPLEGSKITVALTPDVAVQDESPKQPIDPSPTQNQPPEQTTVEPEAREAPLSPTHPARTEHDERTTEDRDGGSGDSLFWGDGIAQWVMAITGIGALGLSGWAVWLLKGTLDATRDAVRAADDAVTETRRIGEAQVRAYLSCEGGSYRVAPDSLTCTIKLRNHGQSPATKFTADAYVSVSTKGDPANNIKPIQAQSKTSTGVGPAISSGGDTTIDLWWSDVDIGDETHDFIYQMGGYFEIRCTIIWEDVFKNEQTQLVMLDAELGRHVQSNGVLIKTGGMTAYNISLTN